MPRQPGTYDPTGLSPAQCRELERKGYEPMTPDPDPAPARGCCVYCGEWGPSGAKCQCAGAKAARASEQICEADEEILRAAQCTDAEIRAHLLMHEKGLCPIRGNEDDRAEYGQLVQAFGG